MYHPLPTTLSATNQIFTGPTLVCCMYTHCNHRQRACLCRSAQPHQSQTPAPSTDLKMGAALHVTHLHQFLLYGSGWVHCWAGPVSPHQHQVSFWRATGAVRNGRSPLQLQVSVQLLISPPQPTCIPFNMHIHLHVHEQQMLGTSDTSVNIINNKTNKPTCSNTDKHLNTGMLTHIYSHCDLI